MNYLIAIYTGKKIFTLNLKPGDNATIGEAQTDTITLDHSGLGDSYLVLTCDNGGVRILSRQPVKIGSEVCSNRVYSSGDIVIINEVITLALFDNRNNITSPLSLNGFDELLIGRSYNNNDICLKSPEVSSRHACIQNIDGRWTITDTGSRNGTFVNGELIDFNKETPAENVNIFICGFVFYIHNNELIFSNTPSDVEFSPTAAEALVRTPTKAKRYPFFQRSPRLRTRAEKSEFEISAPPNIGNKPALSWLTILMPPCMMVLVMGSVALFTKNYSMLLYSLPMSLMSVVVTIMNNKNSLKKWQKTNGLAAEKYSEHLTEKENEINEAEGQYISALSSLSPGVHECLAIAEDVNRRLWERTPKDNDFLSVRLGTGQIPSNVSIKIPHAQMAVEDNPFIKQTEVLYNRHTVLTGVPVCHSFLDYPITGLAGKRDSVIKMAWRIVMDIASHHSYEDVKIICVYPEEERSKWEWIRWLPHVWNSAGKKRYLAYTSDEARIMLRESAETLKVRRRDAGNSGSRKSFIPEIPFYFLLLADRNLTESCGEELLPENAALGFAALYAYGDLGSLPGECQSVIMCDGKPCIQNTEPDAPTKKISFIPDNVQLEQLDKFARSLAPVRLVQSGKGSRMPTSISFLQGFNAKLVKDIDVIGRWMKSSSATSLAVPIGIKENGDIFYFDVYEKAMGPHGIAAGTSGSGKSEMLTTWLLSMALSFSPEDVNFALIEFKGNDLSNILKGLPHVAGVVSNLNDPSTIIRGLKSLKGEKERRQLLFEQATWLSTKSISAYQKYYKQHMNEGIEPLPYLIIVIDEFAELVTQYPEFNDEIISIARVGRSVGMYMTLTMQSPQGVVKGQVSSNTKFRVCLRTANAGESKEIIGTDDAFNISAPGRAIIKVGNNEVYEQVQTFYAKAPYRPNSDTKGPVGEIRLIELDGTRKKPEIYDKTIKASRDEASEGVAISSYIVEESEANHFAHARPVWTEPLPEMLALDELIQDKRAFDPEAKTWTQKNSGLDVTAGRIDDPENQKQYPFVLHFMSNGHQVLYGAPSSGKTTFLQTVLLSAALSYTPEEVNLLIFDYGSFIMRVFETLPHTIISADPTDEEKVKKAKNFLQNEISKRRKLFSAQGVANLEAYREDSGKTIPAIIVAVDNMASLSNQSPDLMDVLIQTARDGGGLGIYLMITAGNSGSFMYKISQYVKANHTLQMTDKSDYRQFVGGDGKTEPGKYPGRGLTKGPLEFQTALCVEGSTDGERVKKLRALCAAMSEAWTGKRASLEEAEAEAAAPVEAGELSFSDDGVQIGVRKGSREPVEFVFSEMNGCVISGTYGGGKSSTLAMIAQALEKDGKTKLYIYEDNDLISKLCPSAEAAHTGEEADKIVAKLADEFDSREDENGERIVFCIDDFYDFYQEISQESADILEHIAASGAERNMYIYITCTTKGLSKMQLGQVKLFKEFLSGGNAIIIGGNLKEYQVFDGLHHEDALSFGDHEGCMIHNTRLIEMRFAKPEGA